ncbi:hypothetical protein [Hymenobacter gummosus]|uniref:hypothetical protein n=1 Tax=Hymenobacter gummosus TaxID=1776032 RepID=UPI001A9EC3EC|nr:hypothetical protein [Hymenobacter gummosus]
MLDKIDNPTSPARPMTPEEWDNALKQATTPEEMTALALQIPPAKPDDPPRPDYGIEQG